MTTAVEERIYVAPGLLEGIQDHARREKDKGGYEAVGFLARKRGYRLITTRVGLNNHSSDPTRTFFVEPWEQFRAERALAKEGYEIVGVYHSHPSSEALPSKADQQIARPGELMMIYSVIFDAMGAWREINGFLLPVTMRLEDSE